VGAVGSGTLVLHWDGRTWARVPSPSPGTGSDLLGVAASSAGNAWAVGGFRDGGPLRTLAIHCC
jgi:hypothetical protein